MCVCVCDLNYYTGREAKSVLCRRFLEDLDSGGRSGSSLFQGTGFTFTVLKAQVSVLKVNPSDGPGDEEAKHNQPIETIHAAAHSTSSWEL